MKKKVFPFKKKSEKSILPSVAVAKPTREVTEELTGYVRGIPANSEAEERFARGLEKNPNVVGYWFRVPMGAPRGMPGWKELDFLVQTASGQAFAFQIADFEFIHHGAKATAYDQIESQLIKDYLSKDGFIIDEVTWVDANKLADQEEADFITSEIQ